jgi:hypothetical protein
MRDCYIASVLLELRRAMPVTVTRELRTSPFESIWAQLLNAVAFPGVMHLADLFRSVAAADRAQTFRLFEETLALRRSIITF